ncbi:MAG: hypothetical protein IPN59_06795 [Holophaga sp.]|nr:hypothetical protein [Holophaga sp.]
MSHLEQKTARQITRFWGGIFALPLLFLMAVQLVLINNALNHNELASMMAMKLLALVAGQVGVFCGVFLTPNLIATTRNVSLSAIAISAVFHSLVWSILFAAGWSVFYGAKLHRIILPSLDRSVFFVLVCTFGYAFFELLVISWRLRKHAHPA